MIIDYQEYITSPEWEAKREQKLEEQDHTCEICGGRATQAHHLHYRTLGNESMEDLQALCWECHQKEHPEKDKKKKQEARMAWRGEVSLSQVRNWLRKKAAFGAYCPCCQQKVKLYPRTLSGSHMRILLEFYRFDRRGPQLFHHYHDVVTPLMLRDVAYSKLQFWDLLEPDPKDKGRWRITDLGIEFLAGRATIPKYAVTYNGVRIRFSGKPVTVEQCWDKKFDYDELMYGTGEVRE